VERGDEVIIPEGNTLILPNDSVYVFARSDMVDQVSGLFR
jgi:trk system potassium uptake protein TrkA